MGKSRTIYKELMGRTWIGMKKPDGRILTTKEVRLTKRKIRPFRQPNEVESNLNHTFKIIGNLDLLQDQTKYSLSIQKMMYF